MPRPSGSRSYDYRGDRDEPIELAGGGGGAGDRASSAQETRSRPGRPPQAPPPLARGGGSGRPGDHAHCRRLRGWPRRLLVGALAPGSRHRSSRHRSSCHSPDQRGRLPRASARQDRPARHRPAQARVPGLAEGRAGPLPHGCHSDPGGRGCPAPHPRARRLGGRAHPDREPDQSGPGAPGSAGLQAGLAKALERLDALRTPEGTALPPNTRAELHRDMARLHFVTEQIQQIEAARSERLEQAGAKGPNAMVRLLAQVVGVGIETADMLVHEVLSRNLRDRRAVARYAGLTGSPDESGRRRREKGLAKAGNARVRRGMIQLAWRFLLHQKESALAQWYRARTADARGSTRKTLIVALARKLLIAFWRMVTTGETPAGVVLRPAG